MSKKHKYTTDGKKVVVIGNLNSKEIIVQEVFISDGSEIPSGEHFVVKSLHDAPAESWKDKDLRKREANYEERRLWIEIESKSMSDRYDLQKRKLKAQITDMGFCAKHLPNATLETLLMFISGGVTHVVTGSYSSYEIQTFGDAIGPSSGDRFDNDLKLVSLFGSSKGDLEWRINQYRDGSGGSWKIVTPCRSLEDAIMALEDRIIAAIEAKGSITESMIEAKGKYGLSRPNGAEIKALYTQQINSKNNYIEKRESDLSKDRESVAIIQAKLDGVA